MHPSLRTSLMTLGSGTLGTGVTYSRFHRAGYWPVTRAVLMMSVRGVTSSTITYFLSLAGMSMGRVPLLFFILSIF